MIDIRHISLSQLRVNTKKCSTIKGFKLVHSHVSTAAKESASLSELSLSVCAQWNAQSKTFI